MTSKQLDFINKLFDERQIPDGKREQFQSLIDQDVVSTALASSVIEWLLTLPYKADAQERPGSSGLDLTGLASGRYAVGDVLFKIDVVESGKWAGWVFVKDGSEYHGDVRFGSQKPGGTYWGKNADLIAALLEAPLAASQRYGQITGTCGRCGRPLEDAVSVERGIGPVCWEKVA